MRKIYKYALLLAAACASLTSCGLEDLVGDDEDDDDEIEVAPDSSYQREDELWSGELDDAWNYDDAVKYMLTDGEYQSVELTESGNYIVVRNMPDSYYAPARDTKKTRHAGHFRKNTRDYDDDDAFMFGSYSKGSDGWYHLEGFGSIRYDNGSLEINLPDGSTLRHGAYIQDVYVPENALTRRFCRTWYAVGAHEEACDINGNIVYSHDYNDYELRDELVKYVIVSRSNTFTQVEWDDTIESYGTWGWIDMQNQYFSYNFINDEGSGYEQVIFVDNRAYFIEEYTDHDDNGNPVTYRFIITAESR